MTALAYSSTPDVLPGHRVELTPPKAAAALQAFFEIMDAWAVSMNEARTLLGRPGRSTLFKWKRGDVGPLPYDTLRRISYVLGVYQALQILLPDLEAADTWVRKPNTAFGGGSALQRMLGGDVTDLAVVRRYLDTVRGQGA